MVTTEKAVQATQSCLRWPVKTSPLVGHAMPTGIEEFDRYLGGLPCHSIMAIMTTEANKIWALEVSQKIVETNAEHLFGNSEEQGVHLASFQKPLSLDEIVSLRNLTVENNCCAIFTHTLDSSKYLRPGINLNTPDYSAPYEVFSPYMSADAFQMFSGIANHVDLMLIVDEFREPWTLKEHEKHRDGVPSPDGDVVRLNLVKSLGDVRHFFVKKSDL